jgi:hypothetical protein
MGHHSGAGCVLAATVPIGRSIRTHRLNRRGQARDAFNLSTGAKAQRIFVRERKQSLCTPLTISA